MEKIILKNKRNLNLVGDFHKADSNKLIILAHGFLENRQESGRFEKVAEVLNKEGFNVVKFDFAGSGESDNEDMCVKNEVEDLDFIINYYKNKNYKIGLLGFSLGGYVSLKNCNERIITQVLWNPVSDKVEFKWEEWFPKQALKKYEETGVLTFEYKSGPRKSMNITKENFEIFDKISQKELITNIKVKTLIIHGSIDELINIEDSKTAIKLLSKESKLEIINGAYHEIEEFTDEYINKTNNWFKENLN